MTAVAPAAAVVDASRIVAGPSRRRGAAERRRLDTVASTAAIDPPPTWTCDASGRRRARVGENGCRGATATASRGPRRAVPWPRRRTPWRVPAATTRRERQRALRAACVAEDIAQRYVPGRSLGGAHSRARARRHAGARRQLAHLLELLAGRHLLGEQRRLDAVEQALEPADELGLGDAQLGLGGTSPSSNGRASGCSSSLQVGRQRRRTARRSRSRRSRRSRSRLGSSSGGGRTSSSSCLIIEPMRITLAG